MDHFDLSPLNKSVIDESSKFAKEMSEGIAHREARNERMAEDIKAIRNNTDSIVDYFYQSMINLDILNKTLEKSGKTLEELSEIKEINASIYEMLQEEKFQTEKERLDLVSRLMKAETGVPLVGVLQEIILYVLDKYDFKQ